jgi:Na+-driven multidrug efflux pump
MTSSLIAPVTTAFITYQVAQFGQEAVAGFGIASRLEGLSLLALMALSAAITPFVGQNYGARLYERVQDGVHWCYRFSLVYGSSWPGSWRWPAVSSQNCSPTTRRLSTRPPCTCASCR